MKIFEASLPMFETSSIQLYLMSLKSVIFIQGCLEMDELSNSGRNKHFNGKKP